MASFNFDEIRRKFNNADVAVSPWKDPMGSVLPVRGGPGPLTFSADAFKQSETAAYKVRYPMPKDDEEVEDGEGGEEDEGDEEEKEEKESDPVDSLMSSPVVDEKKAKKVVEVEEKNNGKKENEEPSKEEDNPTLKQAEVPPPAPSPPPTEQPETIMVDEPGPDGDIVAVVILPEGDHADDASNHSSSEKKVMFAPGTPDPKPTHRKKKSGKKGKKKLSFPAEELPSDIVEVIDMPVEGNSPPEVVIVQTEDQEKSEEPPIEVVEDPTPAETEITIVDMPSADMIEESPDDIIMVEEEEPEKPNKKKESRSGKDKSKKKSKDQSPEADGAIEPAGLGIDMAPPPPPIPIDDLIEVPNHVPGEFIDLEDDSKELAAPAEAELDDVVAQEDVEIGTVDGEEENITPVDEMIEEAELVEAPVEAPVEVVEEEVLEAKTEEIVVIEESKNTEIEDLVEIVEVAEVKPQDDIGAGPMEDLVVLDVGDENEGPMEVKPEAEAKEMEDPIVEVVVPEEVVRKKKKKNKKTDQLMVEDMEETQPEVILDVEPGVIQPDPDPAVEIQIVEPPEEHSPMILPKIGEGEEKWDETIMADPSTPKKMKKHRTKVIEEEYMPPEESIIMEAPPSPTLSKSNSHKHRADHWERPARKHTSLDGKALERPRSSKGDSGHERSSPRAKDKLRRSRRSFRSPEEEEDHQLRREARRAREIARIEEEERQKAEEEELRYIRHEARRAARKAAAEEMRKRAKEEAEAVAREEASLHRRRRHRAKDDFIREPRIAVRSSRPLESPREIPILDDEQLVPEEGDSITPSSNSSHPYRRRYHRSNSDRASHSHRDGDRDEDGHRSRHKTEEPGKKKGFFGSLLRGF